MTPGVLIKQHVDSYVSAMRGLLSAWYFFVAVCRCSVHYVTHLDPVPAILLGLQNAVRQLVRLLGLGVVAVHEHQQLGSADAAVLLELHFDARLPLCRVPKNESLRISLLNDECQRKSFEGGACQGCYKTLGRNA